MTGIISKTNLFLEKSYTIRLSFVSLFDNPVLVQMALFSVIRREIIFKWKYKSPCLFGMHSVDYCFGTILDIELEKRHIEKKFSY